MRETRSVEAHVAFSNRELMDVKAANFDSYLNQYPTGYVVHVKAIQRF